jgi:hypothetical protein
LSLVELKDDEEMVVVGLMVEGPLRLTLRATELFDDEEEDSQETDCVMRETRLEVVPAAGLEDAEGLLVAAPEGNVLLLVFCCG